MSLPDPFNPNGAGETVQGGRRETRGDVASDAERRERLGDYALREVRENILPFWHRMPVDWTGVPYAFMFNNGAIDPLTPRSIVFVARLLWTFSEAVRHFNCAISAQRARAAYLFLAKGLADPQHGGFFWSVDSEGLPADTDKHVYGHAFAIYGLAAYARAFGHRDALHCALDTAALIAARAARPYGYHEAFDLSWRPIDNCRLAANGLIAPRTANTHLHLLEALTLLTVVSNEPTVTDMLRELLRVLLDRFLAPGFTHTHALLDEQLLPLPGPICYGHDIESSWLLDAAADALSETALAAKTRIAASALARSSALGQLSDGSMITMRQLDGTPDPWRLWWVQAEAALGFINEWTRGRDPRFLARAEAIWSYIEQHIKDPIGGEWFSRVDAEGRYDVKSPKVEPWKEPYHQARACFEIGCEDNWLA